MPADPTKDALAEAEEALRGYEPTWHYRHHNPKGIAGANCPQCQADGRNHERIKAALSSLRRARIACEERDAAQARLGATLKEAYNRAAEIVHDFNDEQGHREERKGCRCRWCEFHRASALLPETLTEYQRKRGETCG
jgi:hypothetical protein